VRTPSATTPPRVARNLVIVAVIESLDEVAAMVGGRDFAFAVGASATAHASTDKPAIASLRMFPLPPDG
jgi:hypothetical protein